jgi:tetratricopeptide (TPR) repeat protein
MTDRIHISKWTRERALLLAGSCLTLGIIGGWCIQSWQHPGLTGAASVTALTTPATKESVPATTAPAVATSDSVQLKAMADSQATPLLDKLKSDGNNPDLLASIGNLYYDAQQYPIAIDYYGRALKVKPRDAAMRTDMATAYWYLGNADLAIAQFNKALMDAPNNPNTLFNLGLVKWKGKRDCAGAVADWEKLLATNPHYEGKDKVEQMMNEAKNQAAVKP